MTTTAMITMIAIAATTPAMIGPIIEAKTGHCVSGVVGKLEKRHAQKFSGHYY